MREKDPKSNISSTSYRSCSSSRRTICVVVVGRVAHPSGPSRRRTVRVVEVGRVAHPVGRSPRCAICAPVLRPLRLATFAHAKMTIDGTIRIVVFCFILSPIRMDFLWGLSLADIL